MRIKKNIAVSETGFVFDPTSGDSFSLNAVGLEILQYVKAGQSQEEISDHITEKYDVDRSAFEHYYLDFLSMLKHYQILENHDEHRFSGTGHSGYQRT
jgi:hypothetical protein